MSLFWPTRRSPNGLIPEQRDEYQGKLDERAVITTLHYRTPWTNVIVACERPHWSFGDDRMAKLDRHWL